MFLICDKKDFENVLILSMSRAILVVLNDFHKTKIVYNQIFSVSICTQ